MPYQQQVSSNTETSKQPNVWKKHNKEDQEKNKQAIFLPVFGRKPTCFKYGKSLFLHSLYLTSMQKTLAVKQEQARV